VSTNVLVLHDICAGSCQGFSVIKESKVRESATIVDTPEHCRADATSRLTIRVACQRVEDFVALGIVVLGVVV
jgi:DAN domain